MTDLRQSIDPNNLPRHIAVIMDGNGRWAKQRGMPRTIGHRQGVKSVRTITEAASEIGIEFLTLYTFSTENWNRPPLEVQTLMALLVESVNKEIKLLHENNVRLQIIGHLPGLPERTRKALLKGVDLTANNTGLTLILALNYSARWEITEAARKIAQDTLDGTLKPQDISEETIGNYLTTALYPDPELMIRTSGEHRLSNFLLWQLAYAEFAFLPVLWPDFQKDHLFQAVLDFQNRERRFGQTGEQINPKT
jgi:undecaprenyl diphosphate synthase